MVRFQNMPSRQAPRHEARDWEVLLPRWIEVSLLDLFRHRRGWHERVPINRHPWGAWNFHLIHEEIFRNVLTRVGRYGLHWSQLSSNTRSPGRKRYAHCQAPNRENCTYCSSQTLRHWQQISSILNDEVSKIQPLSGWILQVKSIINYILYSINIFHYLIVNTFNI